jgi:rubrerythrin
MAMRTELPLTTAARRGVRLLVALALASLATPATAAEANATAENLQAAFAADHRAAERYRAFAARADEEGKRDAAALFRAAARAEAAHARLHANALRALGSEPRVAAGEPVSLRTTPENLRSLLAHENAERVGGYPRFVEQARRDGATEAVLAFTLAHHAEEALVRLYRDAVARPPAAPEVFHVCETCGHVVRGPPGERCPVSLSPRTSYSRVE